MNLCLFPRTDKTDDPQIVEQDTNNIFNTRWSCFNWAFHKVIKLVEIG